VAISSNRYVWGCPGANSGTGRAFFYLGSESSPSEIYRPADDRKLGDQFGYSVAIGGTDIVVGAPYSEYNSKPRAGLTYQFGANSDGSVGYKGILLAGNEANSQLGTAVAISDRNCIVSEPGAGAGKALVLNLNPVSIDDFIVFLLQASDGEVGDNFGNSVAISGKTAVVGAWGDDDVATDAGAAYVFVRGSNNWSQQQKLRADDGRQDDHFSEHAVAIEGNTIVVGAYSWDLAVNGDNAGAAYIFTRSGTVWTRETALFGESAQNFGIGIGLSGNSVLVGARGADAQGIARTGAAYVYRLDCTAPHATKALASTGSGTSSNMSLCPGSGVVISSYVSNEAGASLSRQWCKDGVPIPGPNASGNDYAVNNVSASDVGRYDVVISNACGSEISTPFILSIATFSISPSSGNFGAGGSDGSISVTSAGDCTYTAVPSASWIKITSNESGIPPKNIGFHVDPNTGPNQRTGTITIADKTFTVAQDGLNCGYSITPSAQNFSAAGNTSSVNVTATTGCAWTAVSNDNWLTITSGSNGTGNGPVNYSVAANTGPARTGTLTVAGQTVTVTQANGCTYALNPTAQTFPASIAAGAVNVTTVAGCAWTALSNASFISITSNNSGTGNGTVNYSVGANTSTSSRAGTLTIAGQTFTITQDGAIATTPAVQFSAASYNIGEGDQRVTLNVTRSGDAGSAASVSFATSDSAGAQNCNVITGVASSRCDYERGIGTVKFAAGETSKAISIFIIDDSYLEGTETFSVSLSNPSGTSLGAQSTTDIVVADNESANGVNPSDTAGFFVRLHYLDFFAREPDSGGLNFWTNEITSCGTNAPCLDNKRVNVSAAFYLSIEFQQTGYLVERIYKTAYGNASGTSTFGGSHQLSVPVVRLNEFLPDTQEIGQRVIVGQTGWEQLLENNKQAFTAGFVQRGRFTSAYPNSMTSAQFVDALNTNAGNPLSQSERDQLIGDLMAGAKTRAQALRAVAEDSDLISAESNRAFVLMQFFGYLRRNPNDPQDTDYTGYDFWLTKLNQFNGNFVNAEMVKAFISSAEYRQRFGP
jgi:hypothetical protein